MTLFRKRSWWCDGCTRWHSINARDVEGESPAGGSWCGPSIRNGIKAGRNMDLPGYVIEHQRRMIGGQGCG